MKKTAITLSAALLGAGLAGTALAQMSQPAPGSMPVTPSVPSNDPPPARTLPAPAPAPTGDRATAPGLTAPATRQTDMDKLIGTDIKSTDDETVGEIKAVQIGPSGEVRKVIVGVGGFLGMGERDVAVAWSDLQVMDGGNIITTTMTKEQLKALPEYRYSDPAHRGKVFRTAG
jgi:hypothetical protein